MQVVPGSAPKVCKKCGLEIPGVFCQCVKDAVRAMYLRSIDRRRAGSRPKRHQAHSEKRTIAHREAAKEGRPW